VLSRVLAVVYSGVLVSVGLGAQEAWRSVRFYEDGKLLASPIGIAVKGVAESGGRSFNVYVLLYGAEKTPMGCAELSLAVVPEKEMNEIVPDSELNQFFIPPNLSDGAVFEKSAITICVSREGCQSCFSAPMAIADCDLMAKDVRGDATEMFETNIYPWRWAWGNWCKFLEEMSKGFKDGSILIGKGFFSKPIKVTFSGKGIEVPLRELMKFVDGK
jgi:hypothetical protein